MHWYAWVCIGLFIIGNLRILVRMGVAYAHAPVSFERTRSPYIVPTQSWLVSIKEVMIHPFTKILWNKNPWMVAAHVVYHLGFFGGLATYAIVLTVRAPFWMAHQPWSKIPWLLCTNMDRALDGMPLLHGLFACSAFLGTVGMAIPFILTLRKRRNRIHSPDPNLKIDTLPPSARKVSVSIQRKVIGLFVLMMDPMIFCSIEGIGCGTVWIRQGMAFIHTTIFWLIFALFPYTFLRHEYVRVGALIAVLRRRRRILV